MRKILLILFLTYVSNCIADDTYPHQTVNTPKSTDCSKAKSISNKPNNFPTTNNLIKPDSGCSYVTGDKVIIKGIIIDQNSVPVSDAKVYLWQKGTNLKHSYRYKKNNLDKCDRYFRGTGSAVSNNNGEFYFVTSKPKSSKPIVYLLVNHPKLKKQYRKLVLSPENIICTSTNNNCNNKTKNVYGIKIVMKGTTFRRY